MKTSDHLKETAALHSKLANCQRDYARHLEIIGQLESVIGKQASALTKHDAWFKWFKTQPEHREVGTRWAQEQKNGQTA